MQIQTKFVNKPLQASRQVIDVRVTTELNRDRFGSRVITRIGHVVPRYVVIDPTVKIIAAVVMAIVMGHDIMPTGAVMLAVIVMMTIINVNARFMAVPVIVIVIATKVNTKSMVVAVPAMKVLRARKSCRQERRHGNQRDDP